ncbi:hypothetical protein, partial [Macellibacteroides fermentans]|uniref:hypothetical protein n=1 Tax=Macellibacteroides fermentans TaxID=879969 RepID=UPI00406C4055
RETQPGRRQGRLLEMPLPQFAYVHRNHPSLIKQKRRCTQVIGTTAFYFVNPPDYNGVTVTFLN